MLYTYILCTDCVIIFMCPWMLLASCGMLPYWMNVSLCVVSVLHVHADISSLWIYVYLSVWKVYITTVPFL